MKLFDKKPESFLNAKNQTRWTCAYHLGERITNFCLSEECLLPLCPQCVKVHLQQHSKLNIHGNFQVIQSVVSNVRMDLNRKLERTQKMRSTVENIHRIKGHELLEILGNIRNFRSELFAVLNEYFRKLQEEVKESITLSQEKFQQEVERNLIVSKNLTENVKRALDSLSGNQCMEAIINNYTELKKKEALLDQSCKTIQQQALVKNTISINRCCINEFVQQLETGIEITTVELQEFELKSAVNESSEIYRCETKNQSSEIRVGLSELKVLGENACTHDKFEGRFQEGLIDRLSKTTLRLQNDLQALRSSGVENRQGYT